MKIWNRTSVLWLLAVFLLGLAPFTTSLAHSLRTLSGLRMVRGTTLNGHTTGNSRIDSYLVSSGRRHRVDPLLMYALVRHESGFRTRARSHKGARGLAQLMPSTARVLGVKNIHDPKQNIEGGTKLMRRLLTTFKGNVSLALAGYNAGPGAVKKYGKQVPPYRETQNYVRSIGSQYAKMRPGALQTPRKRR
jgi:soluble lytic murein transglycosylase-like protein